MTTATKDEPKAEGGISAMNFVFIIFVAGAVIYAAGNGRMHEVTKASFDGALSAVNLAIGLIGIMSVWLGLFRVLEAGGLMLSLAQFMRPLMCRLFPEIPANHPAMSAVLLNISANLLGLGNAATPLGIKAMRALNKLNPLPGTATNSMCLFMTLNTSGITLFPITVIGLRAAAGSAQPASIFITTLLATLVSTFVGLIACKFLARRDVKYNEELAAASLENFEGKDVEEEASRTMENEGTLPHLKGTATPLGKFAAGCMLVAFVAAFIIRAFSAHSFSSFVFDDLLANWLLPTLVLLIVCYGVYSGVRVYDAVIEGAKQGFDLAVLIMPYLIAIIVAVEMFQASGAMQLLIELLSPITNLIGMPAEALPLAIVRPLSGKSSLALLTSILQDGPDSFASFLSSTLMGSTETTFYFLAVYFGAVKVLRVRYALFVGLLGDAAGVLASCAICAYFW